MSAPTGPAAGAGQGAGAGDPAAGARQGAGGNPAQAPPATLAARIQQVLPDLDLNCFAFHHVVPVDGGVLVVCACTKGDLASQLLVLTADFEAADGVNRIAIERELLPTVPYHPNVVEILWQTCADAPPEVAAKIPSGIPTTDVHFTLQEFIQQPLRRWIATQQSSGDGITQAAVVPALVAMARGLQHLAQHHIVHRDLNPATVVMHPERGPVISSFKHACRVDDDFTMKLKPPESVGGDSKCLAPEVLQVQLGSDSGKPTVSVDYSKQPTFALGVLVWEMVTGKHPLEGYPEAATTSDKVTYQLDEIAGTYTLGDSTTLSHLPEWPTCVSMALRELAMSMIRHKASARPTLVQVLDALQAIPEPGIRERELPMAYTLSQLTLSSRWHNPARDAGWLVAVLAECVRSEAGEPKQLYSPRQALALLARTLVSSDLSHYCTDPAFDIGEPAMRNVVQLLKVHTAGAQDNLLSVIQLTMALSRQEPNAHTFVAAGGPAVLQQCLAKHCAAPVVAELSLGAIGNLALYSDARTKLVDSGVVALTVQVMAACLDDEAVQEHGCYALRSIATGGADAARSIVTGGGIDATQAAQESHPDCDDIMLHSVAMMRHLAKLDDGASAIPLDDVISKVASSVHHEELQQHTSAMIANLAMKTPMHGPLRKAGVVEHLVNVVEAHQGNVVQKHAIRAMKNLTKNLSSRRLLISRGAADVVERSMMSGCMTPDLHDKAKKVLSKLKH